MIKYTLRCAEDHRFDSWFASADAYDSLLAAGRVTCAVCGGGGVGKALMAPRVGKVAERGAPPHAPEASASAERPLAAPAHPMEAALRALRAKIEASSEYVGQRFASEARAIHGGDQPGRAIHGEATGAEVRALLDEGVPVAPLPFPIARKVN